jgi:peptidoglycan-associated lipoprotein
MMMRKMIIVLVALVFACSALFLMTSCAKKQVMTGAPEKKPPVVAPPPGDTEAYKRAEAERQARLAALAAAEGLRGQIRAFEAENINFDFDQSELKPEARAILVKKAEWLRNNSEFSVRIEGHCDERGTNEYNLALGERRANAAWKFLNALGISGSRMTTISYGEERPADPRHSETAWSKNRRDEFKLIR